MVLEYAEGGNFNNWVGRDDGWRHGICALSLIIEGLRKIHEKKMVHRDFHIGNILLEFSDTDYVESLISDMGLCGEVDNIDATKIYGVMPYVAPEVLKGEPYIEAADIYSFGMIMYFVATGRQPFANHDHDEFLAMKIWKGIRPEINESEAPKCYADLMKRCWDSDPINRPNTNEIYELVSIFYRLCAGEFMGNIPALGIEDYEIKNQFQKAEEFRKSNIILSEENIQYTTHSGAIYVSRLLNPFIKDLSKNDIGN